ncbi:MAG: TetR/AcrR family transcriptional regulator [Chloroflexi bacterium]|nr:TetR/AcrR family transcriptional regulator [Chloroflexota bacterium]
MLSNLKEGQEKLDPRVRRTRQLIEQAFMEVINEKGFQEMTVRDITERAGINRATFYAHFQDKYGLLDQSIRQGFLQEVDKRMLNACHFTVDNLRNLIIAVCEFIKNANSKCKPAQSQFETLVEAQVKEVLYDLLLKWLEQTRTNTEPEIAATATSWAIYGLALQWSHSKRLESVEKFADEVLPLIVPNLQLVEAA